jgi:PAS domain S-box-containing protein
MVQLLKNKLIVIIAFLLSALLVCSASYRFLKHQHFRDRRRLLEKATLEKAHDLDRIILHNEIFGTTHFVGRESLPVIRTVLGENAPDNPEVLEVLETIRAQHAASIVYLLDAKGTTVACTPYEGGKTLTGNNYAFRPYFKNAFRDKRDNVYAALGVTTRKRGLYYASPVIKKQNGRQTAGVVVVKIGLERIDSRLEEFDGDAVLLSPGDVVFASSRPEWLFRPLFSAPPAPKASSVDSVPATKIAPLVPSSRLDRRKRTFLENGVRHAYARKPLEFRDETGRWELVRFEDTREWVPKSRILSMVILVFLLYYFLAVILYFILRRSALETERQELVERAAANYRTIFNSSHDVILVHDAANGAILAANRRIADVFGYSPNEALRLSIADLLLGEPPYSEAEALDYFQKSLERESLTFEFRCRRKDKTPFWAEVDLVACTLDGEARVLAVIQDVTPRKESEQALRERVKELKALSRLSELAGRDDLDLEDLYRKTLKILRASWQHPRITCARIEIDGNSHETDNWKNPPWKQSESVRLYGKPPGKIEVGYLEAREEKDEGPFLAEERSLLKDIALRLGEIIQQKRSEEMLREGEKRFMDVLYASSDAILLIGNNRFVECNEATARMLRYRSREEFLDTHPSELSPPRQPDGRDSAEKADEMIRNAFDKGFHRFEWIHRRADGEDFPVEVSLTPIVYRGESLLYCVWRDITRRKKIEEQARRSHENLKNMLKHAPFGVVIVDRKRIIRWANRSVVKLVEKSIDQMVGAHCVDLLCERGQDRCPVLDDNQDITNSKRILRRADGGELTILKSVNEIEFDNEPMLLECFIDITEQERVEQKLKQAQSHLVQSEKLASIGQLAAGVAHEINNPTGFIMSNLGTLKEYLETYRELVQRYAELERAVAPNASGETAALIESVKELRESEDLEFIEEDVRQLLEESLEGTVRIRDIVQNLKSFARVDESEIKEADLNECLESTIKMAWNELKYKCTVHRKFSDIPPLRCNPGQLNQVFINLLVNAAHAIPEKGDVTVETLSDDKGVTVRIADTGAGIPADKLSKIFEPFFTTKKQGVGTGLGLSISYGIVEKHGGTLQVDSEVGRGTVFTIFLPFPPAGAE